MNKKGCGSNCIDEEGPGIGARCHSGVLLVKNTNHWPCGFFIHPDAPWLGSSPDKVVFDPTENPPFGLLDIKCLNIKSYVDCKYLQLHIDTMKLKKLHSYYWQVQGKLLITGKEWCDFAVLAEDDVIIQRIY